MANKIQYAVPTLEQFIEMHSEICAELTEQEQRVVAKTTINLALAWNESKKKGIDYANNLTPIQREVLRKFIEIASRLGKVNAVRAMSALQNLGI